MVEKFNFYDIYGYLLPGIVFATLFWLPFGLFLHKWPSDLSAALIVVVLSYLIGHIVQSFSSKVFPSATKDKFGLERFPSDLILDVHTAFTMETKKKIDELSQKYFNIALEPQDNPSEQSKNHEAISHRRKDAFSQARSALLKDKATSYWEQFEGLYALMRGISAASAVAVAYFLGWGFAFSRKAGSAFYGFSQADSWTKWGATLLLFFAIKLVQFSLPQARKNEEPGAHQESAQKEEEKNRTITLRLLLLFVAFLTGLTLGLEIKDIQPPSGPFIMLGLAMAALVVSIRCYAAYTSFAWLFAEHVWRDFANIDKPSPPSTFSRAFPNS
ncbi:MAG TPA: hypothetical protein VG759_05250 [Candidatus Angelobacter sp.]|nr:hypothetical protein [Candidatus Angelobacter sp.]